MKELISELKIRNYIVDYKEGSYLNIEYNKVNVEFYPCGDDNYLCATYSINGKETEIDEYLDDHGIRNIIGYVDLLLKES